MCNTVWCLKTKQFIKPMAVDKLICIWIFEEPAMLIHIVPAWVYCGVCYCCLLTLSIGNAPGHTLF